MSFTILFSCIEPSVRTHSFAMLNTVTVLGPHSIEVEGAHILVARCRSLTAEHTLVRVVGKAFAVLLEADPTLGTIKIVMLKTQTSSLTLEDFLLNQIQEY